MSSANESVNKSEDELLDEEEEWEEGEERKLGQTRPTPSPGDGSRVFYETLLQQRPDSYMALKYCIEYGIIAPEKLEKAYKELQRRKEEKKNYKPSSPQKAKRIKEEEDDDDDDDDEGDKKKSSTNKNNKPNKKIKIVKDDEFDDGGGGWEGVGVKTM